MERVLFVVNGMKITGGGLVLATSAVAVMLLATYALNARRSTQIAREDARAAMERQREILQALAGFANQSAGLSDMMRAMAQMLGSRQADLARLVAERLDSVGMRVGAGIEASGRSASEQLARLNERLAVIDAAQARVAALTEEVMGLKEILGNKQARGAFGQGRLEAIIRDALPPASFVFQYTLSNNMRPDCVVRLPGDARVMVIDAKFPLEAFTMLRQAPDEAARKGAAARVRADVMRHVHDIAGRYFIAGETQDVAIMFVPAESLYAALHEHFEDIIQKAHRNRIIIVSPSLLMMAVQVVQAVVRDTKVREEAHLIQAEVRGLIEEVSRLQERAAKLSAHFKSAQEDVDQILAFAGKAQRRALRIDRLDFEPPAGGVEIRPFEKPAE